MMKQVWRKIVLLAHMVKIEHSIFALPFAYLGMIWAANNGAGGWPGWPVFLSLTVAMVSVRSYAMAMNRLLDVNIDRKNPRTQERHLVTGELSLTETRVFIAINALTFVAACWTLNSLCLALSPVVLFWSGFYSLTKRFTPICHYFLGSVQALAPLAGWLAVSPHFALPPVLLSFGVLFWVAGFDIIYACQDEDFDRTQGLYSLPSHAGVPTALALSTFSHAVTGIFFLLAGWASAAGWIYFLSATLVSAILIFEHRLISPTDMSRVNLAFFTMNGFVAVVLFVGAVADVMMR